MAANIETMSYFKGRGTPWHSLGVAVEEAETSEKAIISSGLNWPVIQRPVYIESIDSKDGEIIMEQIDGKVANVRETDNKFLGVVSNTYKIVQNKEAFLFTDALLGNNDIRYETAGSLDGGKCIWLLARLTTKFVTLGDSVDTYLVFTNRHDGNGAVKIAITPIRVVCQNTLNLSLANTKRVWSTTHTGDLSSKMKEAERTLNMADNYMVKFNEVAEELQELKLSRSGVRDLISMLLPIAEDFGDIKKRNIEDSREGIAFCYDKAPDLAKFGDSGWRFVNSVSDFVMHTPPKKTVNPLSFQEKHLEK